MVFRRSSVLTPFRSLGAAARAACVVLLAVSSVRAIEVGDAQVVVERGAGAELCPGEAGVKRAIERVGTMPEGPRPLGSLRLHVRMERMGEDYRAKIRAEGRKTGTRTLDVPGPGCSALTDAVAVTLALLMDREIREASLEPEQDPLPEPTVQEPEPAGEPEREMPEPVESSTAEEALAPAPAPAPRAAFRPSSVESARLVLHLGGAVTHGLPLDTSAMVNGGVTVRQGWLGVGAEGFWGPTRSAELPPGQVNVRLAGVRLRGCGRVWGDFDALHVSGCAEAALAQLRGEGQGFATDRVQRRPWYALGLSARAGGPIAGPVAWTMTAGLLAPLQQESFSVDRIGLAYETDVVTWFAGPGVALQIL